MTRFAFSFSRAATLCAIFAIALSIFHGEWHLVLRAVDDGLHGLARRNIFVSHGLAREPRDGGFRATKSF